ncbi:MAG: formylglycine-generating enzyme family protein, partial [candidate division KSB1 bacterium]|nr:formylglycine-generating enzyme family protein [candidate division KSB1 bacterium]
RGPDPAYRRYPWGNNEPDKETANFGNNIGHVTPVGIFPESCSPEGVIDLAGNVWEWCWDWSSADYYAFCAKQGIVKNPKGTDKGARRVVRGGSWGCSENVLACSFRDWVYPEGRGSDVGFRVACGA